MRNTKKKKMLFSAQKSIMIWDPKVIARKPPKESVNLLLKVDDVFGLSNTLRLSTTPDFLMLTIGGTSYDYIERANDWSIPIISTSQDIINRLPSSLSCFLLLRAYGSDGVNSQLLELAAPLLEYIRKCLKGLLGKEDASTVMTLLFTDIADASPDRRRCARKVFQEAIGTFDNSQNVSAPPTWLSVASLCRCDWLFHVLQMKHAPLLIKDAIIYLVSS